jgi:hypothetical protein
MQRRSALKLDIIKGVALKPLKNAVTQCRKALPLFTGSLSAVTAKNRMRPLQHAGYDMSSAEMQADFKRRSEEIRKEIVGYANGDKQLKFSSQYQEKDLVMVMAKEDSQKTIKKIVLCLFHVQVNQLLYLYRYIGVHV